MLYASTNTNAGTHLGWTSLEFEVLRILFIFKHEPEENLHSGWCLFLPNSYEVGLQARGGYGEDVLSLLGIEHLKRCSWAEEQIRVRCELGSSFQMVH